MMSFKQWLSETVNPDGPEVEKPLIRGIGALPTYSDDDAPPTTKNKSGHNDQELPNDDKMLARWMKRKMKKK
jgi:hypothetical protein